VSVDAQRDVRLGVPKALADGDNIDAGIDELAGVSVPQGMKDDIGQSDTGRKVAPGRADGVPREWGAFDVSEQQDVVRQPSYAKPHAEFELRLAMFAQGIDQNVGQGDVPAASL
jgi:hypothetical protein